MKISHYREKQEIIFHQTIHFKKTIGIWCKILRRFVDQCYYNEIILKKSDEKTLKKSVRVLPCVTLLGLLIPSFYFYRPI